MSSSPPWLSWAVLSCTRLGVKTISKFVESSYLNYIRRIQDGEITIENSLIFLLLQEDHKGNLFEEADAFFVVVLIVASSPPLRQPTQRKERARKYKEKEPVHYCWAWSQRVRRESHLSSLNRILATPLVWRKTTIVL